jgi:hypothetical protein
LAIFGLIYKPDPALSQYWVINHIFPNWRKFSDPETKKFALYFEPNNNSIDKIVKSIWHTRYLQAIKKNIPPFILMKNLADIPDVKLSDAKESPALLNLNLLRNYDALTASVREKVLRGTIRALIFILLTKVSLAFLLELPFEKYLTGEANYLPLAINICFPPVLMLIMGTFVKSVPAKNRDFVAAALDDIFCRNKIEGKVFSLVPKNPSSLKSIFNFWYSIFSIGLLAAVIWGLILLKFNVLSIALFFLFVSAVAFFSFRIRNIALELQMKPSRGDGIMSIVEFLFLPFIRIGKFISDRLTKSNPFISLLDFLIGAPLKVIIKIFHSWLRFVNAKKEEIEF